jgi:hypothetical protein
MATAEQALQAAAELCRKRADNLVRLGLHSEARVTRIIAEAIARLDLSPASVSSVNLRPDGAGAGNCGEEEQP